jgi:hypothetical protein
MTRDEIIETAVKAGMHIDVFTLGRNVDLLESFAKLVAQQVQAEEREACALICEELKYDGYEMVKDNPVLARKIRARGQTS